MNSCCAGTSKELRLGEGQSYASCHIYTQERCRGYEDRRQLVIQEPYVCIMCTAVQQQQYVKYVSGSCDVGIRSQEARLYSRACIW